MMWKINKRRQDHGRGAVPDGVEQRLARRDGLKSGVVAHVDKIKARARSEEVGE